MAFEREQEKEEHRRRMMMWMENHRKLPTEKYWTVENAIDVDFAVRSSLGEMKMSITHRDDYVRYEDKNKLKAEDLSTEQRQFLVQLNEKLVDIEKGIKKECQSLIEELEKRITDSDDWLEDYEIDCIVSFHLREDDPDYSERSDNFLAEFSEPFKSEFRNCGIADGVNYNETKPWDHPMKDEHHCWLYHELYDHAGLGWVNVLRIGSIWVDIHVYYQKFYDI